MRTLPSPYKWERLLQTPATLSSATSHYGKLEYWTNTMLREGEEASCAWELLLQAEWEQ